MIGREVVVKVNGAHIISSASQEVIPFMDALSSHRRSADDSVIQHREPARLHDNRPDPAGSPDPS